MKAETWFFFVQIFGENRDTDCCADRLHVADFSSDEPPMRSWCGAGWSHCSVTTRKNESATERIYTQARWVQQGKKRSCTLQQIRCICHESHMSATKPHEYGKELACRDGLQNNHARVGDVTEASWWVSSQHTACNCSWEIFEEASVWVKYLEPFQRLSYQQKTITVAK